MSRMLRDQMPEVKYSVTRLGGGSTQFGIQYSGGLDLVTPSLALQPGALRAAVNYECSASGGYGRIQGYERSDGRALPSAAVYRIVQINAFTNVPTVGQTLTQAVSGATGTIAALSTATNFYLVLTQVTGTFDSTHNVLVGATPIGTAITQTYYPTAKQNAQYLNAAADIYRALIAAVPGSGLVTGVVGMIFSGVDNVYAFRPNVGNTAVALYKQTAGGWSLVPFFNAVSFTAGTALPLDGDTLTQGGVTATIKRVMWASGTIGAGTAAGTLVVTNPAGGNFAAGAATSSSGGAFTLSGVQSAITLAVGGKFEFVKCNFSGQLITRRIYGCDGVNKAFEFDGETLAPITSGYSPDVPSHIAFHKNYLWLSKDASMSHCGPGTPFKWSSVDGGGEIATGDTVNAMISLPGADTTAALAVYLRGDTAILYGIDPTTFNYVMFNSGQGALAYSAQNLADTFVFDDFGVVSLKTTLNYGNFSPSALTRNILPFVEAQRGLLVYSAVHRAKSQYRVFFSNGYGLYVTVVNQNYLGAMPVLFPNPVTCYDTADTVGGGMASYFGSSNGFVYKNDSGTSFDGASIDAYITLAWDPIKSPRILKIFRAASIEMQGTAYAEISFGYTLGYGSMNNAVQAPVTYPSGFSPAPQWDVFTWDDFIWDGQTLAPTDVDMTGTDVNVQVTLSSTTDYIDAFNINSVVYQYTPRRGLRV